MAQPPPGRGAAAEAEGGGGGNREPPGAGAGGGGEGGGGGGGGRAPPGSAAWNGSCGLRPAATTTEDDGNDDGDGDGSSTGGCCRCRARDGSCGLACPRCAATEQRPPPPAPREAEEGEEDATGEDPGGAGKGSRRPRRRQRPRLAPKEKEKEEGGRRQRPARKRSRGARTEELARLKALLEAALGQARRLCVEAGGRLLCSCCRLGTVELGSAPGTVRSWGRRVGQRARSGWLRAARGLRAGAEVARRLLWMLCALLLLLLVLLLGCLRLCWRAVAAGVARLGRTRLAAFLDATGLRRTWGLLGAAGTCQRLRDWLRRWRAPPGELRTGCGPGDAAPGLDGGAPAASSGEEVARLLAMADVPEEELNPFQALGVEATASDAELKKAYRRLAVLVRERGAGGWRRAAAPLGRGAEPPLRLPGPPGQERAPASGGGLQGAAGGLGHRQQPREEEGVRDVSGPGRRAGGCGGALTPWSPTGSFCEGSGESTVSVAPAPRGGLMQPRSAGL